MFGKSNEKTEAVKGGSNSTTIITSCMEIKGTIQGCGTVHIDGVVHGDLIIDENIIIGESGKVYGNIKAQKIMISGTLEGSVVCNTLDVSKTGVISNKINARNIVCDGTLEATILAEERIHITENGNVDTNGMESKHIVVNGHIHGDVIASELLEINKDGQVKGTMKVKKIKVTEGGLMLGSMLTYDASDAVKKASKVEVKAEEEVDDKKETTKNK
ncbi:MAG: Unknown protein [uncultured Sulfurovum sp.]|uniref:Polymer-forming bactofilin n=1 Tax=uncultured Sulfurovum sp. TaxID=269237 RepID=A0A6S6RWT2_9BACT|nr:MAG: Unknown protein [uncultured Sulfurovum sp.]